MDAASASADAGWAWARCDQAWAELLEAEPQAGDTVMPSVPEDPSPGDSGAAAA